MENIIEILKNVQKASYQLVNISEKTINKVLSEIALKIVQSKTEILRENKKDLAMMPDDDPRYDRLKLTEERLETIASDIRNIVNMDYRTGKIIEEKTLENGLKLSKVSVPLGVIGIIYESRPNVTFDVFSLCFKSGNACVLKGGKEAAASNLAIIKLIHSVLENNNINTNVVYLLPNDKESLKTVMNADKYIEVIIPRGSQSLINFVRENSRIPVIETGAGIVHTFIDKSADPEKAKKIINNAKTRRPSVCNSLDTLLIHQSKLESLAELISPISEKVEIYADQDAYNKLKGKYPDNLLFPAGEEDFGREFLSLKMSVKTVKSLEEAIGHISRYSSRHSEAIISEDPDNIEYFLRNVDAAALYVNTSTAFTDGAQFGMGAEIGISTQKLHARGPMSLPELSTYKWIIRGNGQIREN